MALADPHDKPYRPPVCLLRLSDNPEKRSETLETAIQVHMVLKRETRKRGFY